MYKWTAVVLAIITIVHCATKMKHENLVNRQRRISSILFWVGVILSAVTGFGLFAIGFSIVSAQFTGYYLRYVKDTAGVISIDAIADVAITVGERLSISLAIIMGGWRGVLIIYGIYNICKLARSMKLEIRD